MTCPRSPRKHVAEQGLELRSPKAEANALTTGSPFLSEQPAVLWFPAACYALALDPQHIAIHQRHPASTFILTCSLFHPVPAMFTRAKRPESRMPCANSGREDVIKANSREARGRNYSHFPSNLEEREQPC